MSRTYKCPSCQNEIDAGASVCPHAGCHKELAFCSHCRDVTTYTLVERAVRRWERDRFRCDRCQRVGVRCLSWVAGGYCNGLARAGEHWDRPFCVSCNQRVGELGRSVVSWTLIGALGGLTRRRR